MTLAAANQRRRRLSRSPPEGSAPLQHLGMACMPRARTKDAWPSHHNPPSCLGSTDPDLDTPESRLHSSRPASPHPSFLCNQSKRMLSRRSRRGTMDVSLRGRIDRSAVEAPLPPHGSDGSRCRHSRRSGSLALLPRGRQSAVTVAHPRHRSAAVRTAKVRPAGQVVWRQSSMSFHLGSP